MTDKNVSGDESTGVECPTCDDEFDSEHGMMLHHARVHGERLGLVEIECEVCGTVFEVRRSREHEAKYCSEDCQGVAYAGVNVAGNERKRVILECDGCGGEFERPEWHAQRNQQRHFCSQECEANNRPTGEDAHHYKDGYEWHYGPNWDEKIKEVRQRDGYECWLCDMSNGAHTVTFGHGVETHHVQRYHGGGTNDLGNLLALCKYCHHRVW